MLGILSWCMLLLDLFSTSKGSASSSVEFWEFDGRFWVFLEGLGDSGPHQLQSWTSKYQQPHIYSHDNLKSRVQWGNNQPQRLHPILNGITWV